jgi:cadmium resistance protein CadD (predicted permease)
MEWLILVALGVTAFAATNIDDSLLLLLFFGDRRYRIRHVFAGQALGIGLLVLISLAGALLALAVPERWIGLLGLLPIALGARGLADWRRGMTAEAPTAAMAMTTTGDAPGWRRAAAVAGVTLANGGDNIGVYLPLFAARPAGQTALLLAVFAGMLAVWLFGTLYLARRSVVAGQIQRIGHILFPYALIALGAIIVAEAFLLPQS